MRPVNLAFPLVLVLTLSTLIITFENPPKIPSVVLISLEKETPYRDIEYDNDISAYIGANRNIMDRVKGKFMLQSFQQLFKVYLQNPNPQKTGNLKLDGIDTANVDIKYNFSSFENSTKLVMEYRTDECGLQSTSLELKEPEIYNATERFIGNLTICIINLISSKNSSYLFIGNDHGLSLLTLKAAKEISSKSKIGIIVFDEHVDVYGIKDKNNIIGKENVFGKILIEGYADYIVFLEASEPAKQWMEYSVDQNFTRHDIFKKIEVYSDKELMNGKWRAILSNSIKNMKKEGITNIMISVDLDALPTKYTGFEYSILAPATALIRFGYNRSQPSFAEIEEGFSKGLEPIGIKNYIRHIRQQAAINKIKFGVNNGDIIILGDIQELLPKQDLDNKTIKAASQIASFFAG